jgi:polysaccharide export outer membrane protein
VPKSNHPTTLARPSARNLPTSVFGIVAATSFCAMLSACGVPPGMHMVTPPQLVETSTANGDPATEVQIPITPIDLSLIRHMRAAQPDASVADPLAKLYVRKPTPYEIGSGDVLQITVWDHPELAAALGQPAPNTRPSDAAPGFVVDEDGDIQFPYLDRPVHVAGESAESVQREIYEKLSKVFIKPKVTVRIASFRSAQVYIEGDVRSPGIQTINDIPMTLPEAIARAGGFTPQADESRVMLVRDGVSYQINVSDITGNGKMSTSIVLRSGDMLRVASRDENGIYVMGEVNKPATVIPMKNGRLTLSDAISQAGSLNPETSNPKDLYVIRDGQTDKPEIFKLDASSPVSMLLANSFELQSKDVVYVDNSGLVRFSRVLNLLLPAIQTGLTTAVLTR